MQRGGGIRQEGLLFEGYGKMVVIEVDDWMTDLIRT
jgi:hypothetical protein